MQHGLQVNVAEWSLVMGWWGCALCADVQFKLRLLFFRTKRIFLNRISWQQKSFLGSTGSTFSDSRNSDVWIQVCYQLTNLFFPSQWLNREHMKYILANYSFPRGTGCLICFVLKAWNRIARICDSSCCFKKCFSVKSNTVKNHTSL